MFVNYAYVDWGEQLNCEILIIEQINFDPIIKRKVFSDDSKRDN